MEEVRQATAADRPVCHHLVTLALAEARSKRGGATLAGAATSESLLERWADPSTEHGLFLGEFHEAPVGLLAVSAAVRPGTSDLSGLVECCYVEPEARGVGVGTALVAAAVAWCRALSCPQMDSLALPGDRLTKQRLEAAGFTARLLTLSRRLD